MSVAKKLKEELLKNKNNMMPSKEIVHYLINASETNKELEKAIMSEDKTLEKCLKHVEGEVKKKLNNRSGYVKDQEVYNIAASYYVNKKVNIETTLDTAIELQTSEKIKNKEFKAKKEADINKKLSEKDEKIKELEIRIKNIQELNKKEALKIKNKEAKSKKQKNRKKKDINIDGQVSLFDL